MLVEELNKVEEKQEKISKENILEDSKPKIIIKKAITDVNIRRDPKLSATIIRVLKKGEQIEIKEELENWSKTVDGYYIMSKFLDD